MVKLHLVEEQALTGAGVRAHALRELANAQSELGPLAAHPRLGARLLDGRFVFGVEEVLPRHIHALGEVANVHQILALELLHDLFVELLVDLATVQEGGLTLFLRGHHTEEELTQRPAGKVRALVVKEDRLVRRVGRGVVDPLAGLLRREGSLLREKTRRARRGGPLELWSADEREAPG